MLGIGTYLSNVRLMTNTQGWDIRSSQRSFTVLGAMFTSIRASTSVRRVCSPGYLFEVCDSSCAEGDTYVCLNVYAWLILHPFRHPQCLTSDGALSTNCLFCSSFLFSDRTCHCIPNYDELIVFVYHAIPPAQNAEDI